MDNVILVILLILALALIGVVLMQRSEGGGLGIGGGGGVVSGRSAASALGKVTWILGVAFMAMSLIMTILSAQNTGQTSVVDQLGTELPGEGLPGLSGDEGLLPPSADEGPLTPPAE